MFTAASTDGGRLSGRRGAVCRAAARSSSPSPLTEIEATLRRLLRIELLVAARRARWSRGSPGGSCALGLRPLEGIGADRRARSPPATSRAGSSRPTTHGGRPARHVAQRDARPDRGARSRSGARLRGPAPALRRRRVARAADAADRRSAATPSCSARGARRAPEDLADVDGAHRGRGRAHGRARRRPAAARPSRPGPAARARAGRPRAVAADAVDAARAIDPSRPIDARAPRRPLVLAGDAGRLRQVLDNLLENARVHTPPATPTHVGVHADGQRSCSTVADAGPGLDADDAARAFERFYRGDPARSRATGGAGLGLSIVAAIVRPTAAPWSCDPPTSARRSRSGSRPRGRRPDVRFPRTPEKA